MDINIDLLIMGVPDEVTADAICASIRKVLIADHRTDMFVDWKDVTDE